MQADGDRATMLKERTTHVREILGVEAMQQSNEAAHSESRLVMNGALPGGDAVAEVLHEAYAQFRGVDDGDISQVYPELSRSDPAHFGLALVDVEGHSFVEGDDDVSFALMSVAKPFVFALACETHGVDYVCDEVGMDATGLPFNSAAAVERNGGRTNPMVNAGAIATASLISGSTSPRSIPNEFLEDRWAFIVERLSAFAGRELELDHDVLESARTTNFRNRGLGNLLAGLGRIVGDTNDAIELYTRQSCLSVTALDLAVMAATLADGGANPITKQQVVGGEEARAALAAMTIAGMYETSGSWLMRVGLPGKSGIAGGVIAVSPGKGALGSYSPLLDPAGNSVRGTLAARWISRRLGLDILASAVH